MTSTPNSEEIVKMYSKVLEYLGKGGSIVLGDNKKYTKRDLKAVEKYIVDATKKTKRVKKASSSHKKATVTPFYISDQFYNFLNESNYGIGIADFLKKHDYSDSLKEDGSTTKVQSKIKTFLKNNKLYGEAKLYYKQLFDLPEDLSDSDIQKHITDKQIDALIDFKNQIGCILGDRIINNTLKISIVSYIDLVRGEYNTAFPKRRLVNSVLENNLGKGTNTEFLIKGVKVSKIEPDADVDLSKSGFERLEDSNNSKDVFYISESNAVASENGPVFGYLHKAVMKLFSYYIINSKSFDLPEDLKKTLFDPKFGKELEIIQDRIKMLRPVYETDSKSEE